MKNSGFHMFGIKQVVDPLLCTSDSILPLAYIFYPQQYLYTSKLNCYLGGVMFRHRKINNQDNSKNYEKLKNTISKDVAYKATEVIGKYTAEDMLEFAGLKKSNVDKIYLKYRDGLPLAAGMKAFLPDVDIIYINTERKGISNNKVEISPLDEIEPDYGSSTTWFANPINARGTTTLEVLRYLYEHIPFETALLSHVVANQMGINNVQSQITDFNIDSYMNYTFLSDNINQKTGFLEDALEIIPDFGDKVFGTVGADYPEYQLQADLYMLSGTKAGSIELLKGTILFLLQRHKNDEYEADKKVKWATRNWIISAIEWYVKLCNLKIGVDFGQHFDFIMDDLYERGFINYMHIPYKNGYARDYFITHEGAKISTAAYLPFLARDGLTDIIKKDFDFLVHVSPKDIKQLISNYN